MLLFPLRFPWGPVYLNFIVFADLNINMILSFDSHGFDMLESKSILLKNKIPAFRIYHLLHTILSLICMGDRNNINKKKQKKSSLKSLKTTQQAIWRHCTIEILILFQRFFYMGMHAKFY